MLPNLYFPFKRRMWYKTEIRNISLAITYTGYNSEMEKVHILFYMYYDSIPSIED